MTDLIKELYGEEIKKAPFQALIQLDRYTVKELDLSKAAVGDVIVGVVDDSNPDFPVKDFGKITEIDGEQITFNGYITNKEYTVHRRRVLLPLDPKWEDSVDRYVKGVMTVENYYEQDDREEYELRMFTSLFNEDIVPGGRVQASVGGREKFLKDLNLTAYNCYVLPSPRDSRKGIMETLTLMTEIMSRGGGVGINISTLRPKYSKVYGVNGTSSGSVSWGGLYSYATGLVEQGGSRKGALMLQLHITSPDIKEFITVKRESGKITNANLSVQVTKEFMKAVENDDDWHLIYPDTTHEDYDEKWATEYEDIHDWLNAGLPVEIYETVKATELFDLIMEGAHASAEPGYVIYDNMNDGLMTSTQRLVRTETEDGKELYVLEEAAKKETENVVPWNNTFYYQKNIATNPCGEQPLPKYGICNLIHVNMANMRNEDGTDVDWEKLNQAVADAIRYADNVIDYTKYFLEENEKVQKEQRRIGMGTMGLHDLLLDLGLRYGEEDALAKTDEIYGFIKNSAYKASAYLAKERGVFPKYSERILEARVPRSLDADVIDLIKKYGLRNSHLLTQAPTGTTGTKTGKKGYSVSTGIEPFFAIAWERKSRMGNTLDYLGKAKAYLEESDEETLPSYFVSAMGVEKDGTPQISPKQHVDMQAVIQKHNDSAISKTSNVPNDYTVEQTKELYQYGVDSDLVGLTIYRDGSRDEQVLSASTEEKKSDEKRDMPPEKIENPKFYRRPEILDAKSIKIPTPFGKGYVTVGRHPEHGNIEEILFKLGKTGADIAAIADGMAIALTGMLSPRIANLSEEEKVDWIIKKFKGITGQNSVGFGPNAVTSLPDAIAKAFMKMSYTEESIEVATEEVAQEPNQKQETVHDKLNNTDSVDICPACGEFTFVKQDGCTTCLPDIGGCGHSKC